MARRDSVAPGSGNVFVDLEIREPEEALAKARLAAKISSIITHRHLTQAEAAEILGIDQPKVSALMRGRLEGFSTERILRFLNALGRDVEIVIKKRGPAASPGRVRVIAE
ncbi:MAG: helix-turn-helix domain-containing protein [Gemmatimonadota bacterium]